MKKHKFFEKRPELYEEVFDTRDINSQVSFLHKLFSKYRSKKILDIACGHTPQGRKLAKKGYKVSGIDLSRSLLNLGNKRAKQEEISLKLYKRNMKNFNLGKFDASYIMFSSILHLYEYKDLLSHFKSVNKNLRKKGLYIIDLSSLPFKDPLKPAIFKKRNKDIRTIITYKPLNEKKLTAKFTCTTYFHNKKVNEDKFTILMYLSRELLNKLAEKTGFEILDIYSDFKFNKKQKKKPEYIAVLRKK